MNKVRIISLISLLLVFDCPVLSGEDLLTGSIMGYVRDAETRAVITGAAVIIEALEQGVYTDNKGVFKLKNVPVGSFHLQFQMIGYQSLIKTDIIVRSNRMTYLDAELKRSPLKIEGIRVKREYFDIQADQPLSNTVFSYEEVRRAPGSAGDVSRILMSLPSLARINDQSNSLIVRGGNPLENAFYIDNIEIPNINHFPTQGSSGGPIGMLNVDLIRDVNFFSGGFPVSYGDRLSAVMELKLRDGNREEFDGQLDLNFAGFGGIMEGPLTDRGSWLLSLRRSYLDLLIKTIDMGTTIAPTYGDFQAKLTCDIDQENRISLLVLGGDDHSHSDNETGLENDMIYYGDQDLYENTVGLNWQRLWPGLGYSNTSLSATFASFREKFYKTGSMLHLFTNRSLEQCYKIRNINVLRLHDGYSLEIGTDIKLQHFLYDNFFAEQNNVFGEIIPEVQQKDEITALKTGIFMQNRIALSSRLRLNLGIRMDYYTYNENLQISPRGNLNYALTERTALNLSWGIYHQNLPLIILSQNEQNLRLPDPGAIHYTAGISHLLTENTRLTLETYQKEYKHFPVDPAQPGLFLVDEIFYNYGFFTGHGPLLDSGIALSRGVELMIQKKLARDFYGLFSASWFRSRYRNEGEEWRNRSFDNRYTIGIEGGYKPNYQWEFSLRWLYAGGAPYTPFDISASSVQNQGIFDDEHINGCRYPDYHSLNIRCDRRFHFQRSNLVVYFSVWNAYNRKNIASYFWNENENRQDRIYQWSLLPIFGVEYEF